MSQLADRILQLPRVSKRVIALAVDTTLCLAAVAITYYLRLGEFIMPAGRQWLSYLLAVMFSLPLFISFGLYRAIFRHAGWGAFRVILQACVLYGIAYVAVFTLVGIETIPRTTGIIQPILLLLFVGGARAIARFILGGRYRQILRRETRRAVVYGAGSAGRQLAAALISAHEMQIVGFVDDDDRLQGSTLDGRPIYPLSKLPAIVTKLRVSDVLLAIPSASRSRRNEIIQQIQELPVVIRTLPAVLDLAHGRVTINDLRELDIEDLLGREPVRPSEDLLQRKIHGKVVMVTGAGGSIGSELSRQILQLRPRALLLVDMNEYNLYSIHHELVSAATEGAVQLVPLLVSVSDEARMQTVFAAYTPETIYHAAAYKHVPMVESNQLEGIRNNVFGTCCTARLAMQHGAKDFVLISTDKAVRPTSMMGTTKRVAEQALQAMAAEGSETVLSMVRFGNVLGSSGSVVPLFRQQIKKGGPLTVTDARITRYFMTIPEAAQLVLQAGAMAGGGEVFVLDMGEPIRIYDLARRMIELSGLAVRDEQNPDGDIAIEYVGLRDGEKLFEELLIGDNPIPTFHPRILKAHDAFRPWTELSIDLARLEHSVANGDTAEARAILLALVPEYEGAGAGADLIEMANSSISARKSGAALLSSGFSIPPA